MLKNPPKTRFFEKVWPESVDFEFLCENFLKFLGYTQNNGALHLKM